MNKQKYIAIILLMGGLLASNASAEEMLTAEEFNALQQQVEENPDDLEAYFSYAKVAAALGLQDEAVRAYLHMLSVDPLLHRVKLDLGLLYLRTGEYENARHLFEEVLNTNPPQEVKDNITRVLKEAKKQRRIGSTNISLLLGYNFDTNANSAAGSGNIIFNDITIPLDQPFRKKRDSQVSVAASIQHKHSFDKSKNAAKRNVGTFLNMAGTVYRADQSKLDEQNIQALILRLGPGIEIKSWRTLFNLNAGYQYVELDGRSYLDVKSAEFSAVYAHNDKLSFIYSLVFEDRNFDNSPTVTTYSDRSGEAYQEKLGVNYRATQKDILAASISFRKEETKQAYYDNDQIIATGSYTRILPYNMFANASASYRVAKYDGPDPLVSLTKTRNEYEKSAGVTIGKQLKDNITVTTGYQYRKIDSNLSNYDYTNHRIMASIGWSY